MLPLSSQHALLQIAAAMAVRPADILPPQACSYSTITWGQKDRTDVACGEHSSAAEAPMESPIMTTLSYCCVYCCSRSR
jgi:hypothetical protein